MIVENKHLVLSHKDCIDILYLLTTAYELEKRLICPSAEYLRSLKEKIEPMKQLMETNLHSGAGCCYLNKE